MALRIYTDIVQGTDEWHAARCGMLTASTMSNIITAKTLKFAGNDTCRAFIREIAAQRITKFAEPTFVNDDMQRGHDDEFHARNKYSELLSPVDLVGFMVEDRWGFPIGYSPDGVVGSNGLIEIKSRRQKHHIDTLIQHTMPDDYLIQVQTGLMVSGRPWCDFISYCGGLPMVVVRVFADAEVQDAILLAANAFELAVSEKVAAALAAIEHLGPAFGTKRTFSEII